MLKNLLMFLALTFTFNVSATQKVNGAGATFPYPIYSKWFSEYQKTHKNVEFNYQSIGSGGGIKQVLAQTVDFGATDIPMTDAELKLSKTPIRHIPTVVGAVVITYNVSGISAGLKLDGPTLANIFLGTITNWNDASIAKLNPQTKLPATDILIVRRSDGSGTSAIFTEYLATVSSDFKTKVGIGKNVNWPAGIGAKGNEGVTAMVSQTDGAIGYTELAYSINTELNVVSMKNAKGDFVTPSVTSITAAASAVKIFGDDLRMSIINADVKNAYPISAFTYILLPDDKNSVPIKEVRAFLRWALKEGQTFAPALHYATLPLKMSDALLETLK